MLFRGIRVKARNWRNRGGKMASDWEGASRTVKSPTGDHPVLVGMDRYPGGSDPYAFDEVWDRHDYVERVIGPEVKARHAARQRGAQGLSPR